MSLKDKWLDWGPGAAGGWLWALAPGLSDSNVLPLPRPPQPCCSLTAVLSTIKALEHVPCEVLWWLEIRLDITAGSPEKCVIWFHAGLQLHAKEMCQELVKGEGKWGQWSTKTWHKRKEELDKCLWHGNMAQTDRSQRQAGRGRAEINHICITHGYRGRAEINYICITHCIVKAWVQREPGGRGQWVKIREIYNTLSNKKEKEDEKVPLRMLSGLDCQVWLYLKGLLFVFQLQYAFNIILY